MRKFLIPAVAVACLAVMAVVDAQDTLPARNPAQRPAGAGPADEATYRQQVSYALGRNFAQNLQENDIEVELPSLTAGISDTLSGARAKWTDEQCAAALQRFSQEMQQKMATKMQQDAARNSKEAEAFLAQNAKREGVQTTPSGLQYRVLREGNGPSPTVNDTVRCHYRGTLLDGTEFDSSARQGAPLEIGVGQVIPGWTEALQKMKVGDKWQLFVPPKLAYGVDPPGPPIEANSLLVFEIELLDVLQQ